MSPNYCVVADDEPKLRQILVRVMTAQGFTCLEAGNGVEAMERLAQVPAQLLLTDLHMPVMDGVELLSMAKAKYPDLAVILITGVADVQVALKCLASGATDYITKPFNVDVVSARAVQALEKRQLIIQNRAYHEDLELLVAAQARRIEELFLGGVQSIVQALEAKDLYTRGHSIRVSRYASLLAREMGLSEANIQQIELGGHLHDVGKIGVREEVLNKAGPLTDEEYAHIMIHPMVGWQILSPLLGDVPMALNVVRAHHERFDGRGFPDKLQGAEIPLEARIAGVADAFDAMTSCRAYRKDRFMSAEDAIAEVERCSGMQFDPDCVKAFVAVIRREGVLETPIPVPSEEPSGV